VKFLVLTLIANGPDPATGRTPGFAVGERHERPFFSSAPPVVLSRIAARTSRIRLAYDACRPIFAQRSQLAARFVMPVVVPTLEDYVERSSALIGPPSAKTPAEAVAR
jgi:hypothetical protein